MNIFKLPDLGEGLPDAEIHEWHVKEGDTVKTDQLLVSMETAKAVVEVPSPCDGVIAKLHGKAGDVIDVGAPLVEFVSDEPELEKKTEQVKHVGATVAGNIEVGDTILKENAAGIQSTSTHTGGTQTIPAIRMLADKLGIALSSIQGTGHHGQITLDDFANAIKKNGGHVKSAPAIAIPPGDYQPLKGVRKAMAHTMAASHQAVVPVTIVDDADIGAWGKGTDITCRLIRAIINACQQEPVMNAWFDGDNSAIDIKKEIHLGLAMDSGDGLFVPVLKNAESRSNEDLRADIERYKEQVKARTVPQDDLKGATISLSNFGTFAGRYASPIVVPPMVTIVGAGRLRQQVVLVDGKVESHRIMPISVTFDHRAATGGEASRFLKAIIDDLQLEK